MKCLVYGIYILEVVQSALITEMGFGHSLLALEMFKSLIE
jgi:hypothetical protein